MQQIHNIKYGETLSGIAKQYGVSIQDIMKANLYITDPNKIYAGKTIDISTTPQTQQEVIHAPFQPKTDTSGATTDELTEQVDNFLSKTDQVAPVDLGANLPKSGATQDTFDLNKTYEDAFKAAGLDAIKTQFNDLQAKIDERKSRLNEALGQVNENPWLSEASRVGKARRLQELAQPDIDNLINQQKNVKDLFDAGVKQADEMVQRVIQQSTLEKQTRAEARAEKELKLKEEAATKEKIERVGSPDTGVWERDPATGLWNEVIKARKPVNEMTASERLLAAKSAAFAKAKPVLEKSAGKDGFVNPKVYEDLKTQFTITIGDPSSFDELFVSRLSPQERDRLGIGSTPTTAPLKAVSITEEETKSVPITVKKRIREMKSENSSIDDILQEVSNMGYDFNLTNPEIKKEFEGYSPIEKKSWKFWE